MAAAVLALALRLALGLRLALRLRLALGLRLGLTLLLRLARTTNGGETRQYLGDVHVVSTCTRYFILD